MECFDNWFAAENIFGKDVTLIGSQIENIRYQYFGRCYMDLHYSGAVLNPPAKWSGYAWEKVYLRLYFDVKELHIKIDQPDSFFIRECTVTKIPGEIPALDRFRCRFAGGNGDFIELESSAALIQNIKPLVYSEKAEGYIVPDGC